MSYDAITFDNQTMVAKDFSFDSGYLDKLKQFKGGLTKVIVSEVVLREMQKHLSHTTQEVKKRYLENQKNAVNRGLLEKRAVPFNGEDPDPQAIAREKIASFLSAIGAEVIRADEVEVKDLLHLYFSALPPFASAGKKKNEFPDAIALISLEAWAKKEDKHILAISGDSDWAMYAKNSKYIDVIKEIGDGLALLQEHVEQAKTIAFHLIEKCNSTEPSELKAKLEELLREAIGDYHVDGNADSSFFIELDYVALEFEKFEFLQIDGNYDFSVIEFGSKTMAVRVEMEITVDATGFFSITAYDSIDGDEVPLGSEQATTNDTLTVDVLITFEGDLEAEEVGISKTEIVSAPLEIDFGYVEPDFSDDANEDYEDFESRSE